MISEDIRKYRGRTWAPLLQCFSALCTLTLEA